MIQRVFPSCYVYIFCSSGRHTRDTQSESGRSQPDVPRATSKRYPRRTTSDSRLSCKLNLLEDTLIIIMRVLSENKTWPF